MLTDKSTKYWGPRPEILSWIALLIPPNARVLEIGPSSVPFSRATHFVDWQNGPNVTPCDISHEKLPFADKEFDFIYCRHVLEDLYNPFHVCDEMSRVGKAGYIETPSPLAELCRGIDGSSPPWRGYIHHRYVVWNHNGTLTFVAKYPVIDTLSFGDEAFIGTSLQENPLLWNTYHLWQDQVRWKHLQHDVDYKVQSTYRSLLTQAMKEGLRNAEQMQQVLTSSR